ncbi:uncharacterized protein ASCRUDRAFT_68020 [Ascoidea rubescens DSM 1968]|uniref:Uncharacterized protein n=1 Tax=Ascoidea rubescens DSM 1968 TaxID=1344418 RepID=A0A1D2VQU3_9ASCO|nr:hypothetical protein ASCRUDRAFT_68020 [Ascoidea rubescens DSM 1968]ODV63970.1 hypothetical protein ASCRUDRAFT_68020 [Ascoidea rubescens DSM 1968]
MDQEQIRAEFQVKSSLYNDIYKLIMGILSKSLGFIISLINVYLKLYRVSVGIITQVCQFIRFFHQSFLSVGSRLFGYLSYFSYLAYVFKPFSLLFYGVHLLLLNPVLTFVILLVELALKPISFILYSAFGVSLSEFIFDFGFLRSLVTQEELSSSNHIINNGYVATINHQYYNYNKNHYSSNVKFRYNIDSTKYINSGGVLEIVYLIYIYSIVIILFALLVGVVSLLLFHLIQMVINPVALGLIDENDEKQIQKQIEKEDQRESMGKRERSSYSQILDQPGLDHKDTSTPNSNTQTMKLGSLNPQKKSSLESSFVSYSESGYSNDVGDISSYSTVVLSKPGRAIQESMRRQFNDTDNEMDTEYPPIFTDLDYLRNLNINTNSDTETETEPEPEPEQSTGIDCSESTAATMSTGRKLPLSQTKHNGLKLRNVSKDSSSSSMEETVFSRRMPSFSSTITSIVEPKIQ